VIVKARYQNQLKKMNSREVRIFLEILRNETSLKGDEIMKVQILLKERL